MQPSSPDLFRRPRLPSGHHGLSKEFVLNSQRERLLDAAVETIAEKGYAATTVTAVIERAGVSSATYYSFFSDKEECFVAAHRWLLSELIDEIKRRMDSAGGEWPERIRLGLEAVINTLSARPEIARVVMIELMAAGPKAHAQYQSAANGLLPFLREGRELADSPDLIPERTEQITLGAVAGQIFQEVLDGHADDLGRLLPILVYTSVLPYLGHDRAIAEMRLAASS